MLPASVPLLDREMVFVTGKGGVGKTTVAAALALNAARQGRRTIVVELSGQARIPALLGKKGGPPGEEVHLEDNLCATTILSRKALEEWLAKILGSKQLTGLLARSNFFSTFVNAAPGAAELVAMTKAWELAQDERWIRNRRGFDLVIVDAPASGHAIGMLRAPQTFADIARVGPIASQSRRVVAWLRDPAKTAYVAVALPAELPVSETLDLSGRLEQAIGRTLDAVVVNGVVPDRFSDAELAALTAAAPHAELASLVRGADARADGQTAQLARLETAIDVPVTQLPFVFSPGLGRGHVEELAERLPVA
jgi:anion-transporting  ArsA/GET3 family ATPase